MKASFSASFLPFCNAALVVRTFAEVAAVMPANPAAIDEAAPDTKASAVSGFTNAASNPATMTTKITSRLYSLRRKTIAPRWIWPARASSSALATGMRLT